MRGIKKTRVWFNPLTKESQYIVKWQAENKGVVDLVDSYCNKTGQQPLAVNAVVMGVLGELQRLLSQGYQVNIPLFGVLRFTIKSKQYKYNDARKCDFTSIEKIEMKLRESVEFTKFRKKVMRDMDLE